MFVKQGSPVTTSVILLANHGKQLNASMSNSRINAGIKGFAEADGLIFLQTNENKSHVRFLGTKQFGL